MICVRKIHGCYCILLLLIDILVLAGVLRLCVRTISPKHTNFSGPLSKRSQKTQQ